MLTNTSPEVWTALFSSSDLTSCSTLLNICSQTPHLRSAQEKAVREIPLSVHRLQSLYLVSLSRSSRQINTHLPQNVTFPLPLISSSAEGNLFIILTVIEFSLHFLPKFYPHTPSRDVHTNKQFLFPLPVVCDRFYAHRSP